MLRLGTLYNRNDLVFANLEGNPIHYGNLDKRHFKRILKASQLEGFRLYDLRHTMATLLLCEGVNPKVVSERLGHANITLTLETYSHVLPDMQADASNKLGVVLFG